MQSSPRWPITAGPTETHALFPGSPAIDAGDPNISDPPEFDQRGAGFPRIAGGRIDIGAFELPDVEPPSLVVDRFDDVSDPTDGMTTLREAIVNANRIPGDDVVTFVPEASGQTILLDNAELAITEGLAIDADALTNNVIIDAQQQSRVFDFTASSGNLTLAGLTMQNGRTTGDNDISNGPPYDPVHSGGGIRFLSDGILALTGSAIRDSGTTGLGAHGGGIFARLGSVSLVESELTGNSATAAAGGAIYAGYGDVSLFQSTVSGNSASNGGGGIYSGYGAVLLQQSTLSGNRTVGLSTDGYAGVGGGIAAFNGEVNLTESTVRDNSTAGPEAHGGGIYSYGGVTLFNSTVSGNSTAGAEARGGGIYAAGYSAYGAVYVSASTVSGNRAEATTSQGGGIFTRHGIVSLASSTLVKNSAGDAGGGIYFGTSVAGSTSSLDIINSIVAQNLDRGGRARFPDAGELRSTLCRA